MTKNSYLAGRLFFFGVPGMAHILPMKVGLVQLPSTAANRGKFVQNAWVFLGVKS